MHTSTLHQTVVSAGRVLQVDALELHAVHGRHFLSQLRSLVAQHLVRRDVHRGLELAVVVVVGSHICALENDTRLVFVHRRCFHFLGLKLVNWGRSIRLSFKL